MDTSRNGTGEEPVTLGTGLGVKYPEPTGDQELTVWYATTLGDSFWCLDDCWSSSNSQIVSVVATCESIHSMTAKVFKMFSCKTKFKRLGSSAVTLNI